MSEKNLVKIGVNDTNSISFNTSLSKLVNNTSKSEYITFRETFLPKIIVKLSLMIQLILGLQHLKHTIRFATNTSFEAAIHFGLHKVCKTLEINESVIDILDWFFYLSISILAVNLMINLVKDTIFTVKEVLSETIRLKSKES